MPVIGTAGHVDHGKSTLVEALTGIDPDRLAEEKRRGMTIDLGFAHIDLPGGVRAGVVDVPGHARFLHNMVAGVHGMDVVLLVVAADEGVKPQTREHLDIIQLLGVSRVVVALTKVDLVDGDGADIAEALVADELGDRGLVAPVARVAAPGGTGLVQLKDALARAVAEVPEPGNTTPRLPIDRAFVMRGFGTVVTGTLVDGRLNVGDELEVVPGGRRVRVRGLQQHGVETAVARPGNRTAMNLQGVDRAEVRRGQVLATPGTLGATSRLDVELTVLPTAAVGVRHNDRVVVHTGTDELLGRVVVLDGDVMPGEKGWVQLQLAAPVAVRDGDAVVVRRPSPPATLGGGRVADATPAVHRRGQAHAVDRLERRVQDGRVLEELAKAPGGLTLEELAVRLSADITALIAETEVLAVIGAAVRVGDRLIDAARWRELKASALAAVTEGLASRPLRQGVPREGLRGALGLKGRPLAGAIDTLIAEGTLEARGPDSVATPGWAPRLTAAQAATVATVLKRLHEAPLAPPRPAELAASGLDADLTAYLEAQGDVVRLGADLLVLAEAVADATNRVREHLASHGTMTVAEARDLLGSSRRTVVPLLEHLDAHHITRREGDVRRLRSGRPSIH